MANTTATLYIRNKAGYSKAPKRPVNLPEDSTFYLMWYEGTKRKAVNVDRFADAAQVAQANKQAELRIASITGKPSTIVETPAVVPMVRDAVTAYLQQVQGRIGNDGYGASPRTLAVYKRRLSYLLEFDGSTPLTSVDAAYVERFRLFLRERLNSDRYVFNVLQAVNIFLRSHGIEVAKKVLRDTGYAPKKVESYSQAQLDMFFSSCSEKEKLVFQFFLHSMAREREVAYTEVGDLLFDESVLWIQPKPWRKFRLKGKRSGQSVRGRKVPMPRQFMTRLKAYCEGMQPHDLLFPNRNGTVEGHFLAWCQQIAKRAGMNPKEWNLHKFRKTGATMHYKGGMTVPKISTILGHESLAVTQLYLDISDVASEAMVDTVSNGALAAWA